MLTKILIDLIDRLGFLIILDGFDELRDDLKNIIFNEVSELALSFQMSKLILTSRTGDYHYTINNTSVYEICPLTSKQINEFVSKWLKNKRQSKDLLNQIRFSPFADTAIRPLTLAHLCALYERYQKIPDKPKSIYKKIVNLLLEEWDSQRTFFKKF